MSSWPSAEGTMDFFAAQDRARRRTKWLVLMFVLAVLGTVIGGYVATVLVNGQLLGAPVHLLPDTGIPYVYWDTRTFLIVAAVTIAIVTIASLLKWSQMRHGGAAVAEMVGGRRVDPGTTDLKERRLLNVVEEMAIASGMSVPAVFVLENEPGINAFAAGLTTSDAVVAVTRGALDKLTRDELQGVIGHEFSHILNGDMRLNVRLTAIVFGILVIGLIGRGILRSLGRGRVRSGGGKNKGGGLALVLAIGLALMIIGYIGYFFGRLIQAAVSRQREFLADASAVQFTRNPEGISTALKKIGGYALGSRMLDNRAGEISHFFFAQGFRSMFGGWWATHPPLAERIRAVEPRWNGEMFDPPEVVDVSRESFATAGHGGGQRFTPEETVQRVHGATPNVPASRPPARIPFSPGAVIADIGALTDDHFRRAQSLVAALPTRLRDAAHDRGQVGALLYALLLAPDSAAQERQREVIRQHDSNALEPLGHLRPAVSVLDPAARLPLVQLAIPTLRSMDGPALERFVTTLDELVHADAEVSVFEFTLQKMLLHQLEQLRRPTQRIEFHAFAAVRADIMVVLSALAHAGSADPSAAARAFAAGVARLPEPGELALLDRAACGLNQLDTALDRLALSSFPIRQRLLVAAAYTVGADGTVTVPEGELFRAIAAAIDCPVPALAA